MAPYSRTSSDTPIILDASHSQLELLPGSPEPTAEGIREQGHPPSYPGEGGPPRQLPWSGSSASSLKGAALVSRVESDSSLGSSGTENSRNSQRIQPVAYNCTEISGDPASEVTPDNRQSELEAAESERFKLAEVGAPSTCRAHERGGGSRAGAEDGAANPPASTLSLKSRLSIQDSAHLASQVLAGVPMPPSKPGSIRFVSDANDSTETANPTVTPASGSGVPFQQWKARKNQANKDQSRRVISDSGLRPGGGAAGAGKPRQLNLSNTINQVGKRAAEGRLTVFSRHNWTKMGRECLFSVALEFMYCGVMAGVLTALEGEELADAAGSVFMYADRVSHTFAKYTASVYIMYSGIVRIGYGDLVPLTDSGRWWTMAACTGGSVLNIVSIIKLSKLLNATFALVSGRLGLHHIDSVIRLEAIAYTALLVLLLCGNAAVWQAITNAKSEEPWSFTEAFWHSWQTFSTVGYGDFAVVRMQYVTPLTVVYMCVIQWLGLAVTNSVLMRGVELLWRRREYSQKERSYRLRDRFRKVMNLLRRKGFSGTELDAQGDDSSCEGESGDCGAKVAGAPMRIRPARLSVDMVAKVVRDSMSGDDLEKEIPGSANREDREESVGEVKSYEATSRLRRHSTEFLLERLGEPPSSRNRGDGNPRKKSYTMFDVGGGRDDTTASSEPEPLAMSFAASLPGGERVPNSIDLVRLDASDSLGQTSMGRRMLAKRHQTLASFPVLSEFLDISEGVIDAGDNVARHTFFSS